jgi:small subunit ribosomal protein S15
MPLVKNKEKVIKEFGVSANDTGSAQVQIALLSKRIEDISEHLGKNPKDVSSQRGLLQAVADRKTHLDYLKKKNVGQYKEIVSKLGLRVSKSVLRK